MTEDTKQAFKELKHAIRFHLEIMTQPTAQLGAYLVKLVDFFEDEDSTRLQNEITLLAYAITEATAVYVHKALDERKERAEKQSENWPDEIQSASGNILVAIGLSKSINDKAAARLTVLKAVAEALKSLGKHTKADYPKITDADGNVL